MNDKTKKILTEFLGECWHTLINYLDDGTVICTCETKFRCPDEGTYHVEVSNDRIFYIEYDMMALYKRLHTVGKWRDFHDYMAQHCDCMLRPHEFEAWLFCLSGEWYQERCGMVAEFLKDGKEEAE